MGDLVCEEINDTYKGLAAFKDGSEGIKVVHDLRIDEVVKGSLYNVDWFYKPRRSHSFRISGTLENAVAYVKALLLTFSDVLLRHNLVEADFYLVSKNNNIFNRCGEYWDEACKEIDKRKELGRFDHITRGGRK